MPTDTPQIVRAPQFPEDLVRVLRERKVRERDSVPPDQPIPAGARQETLFASGMAMRARGFTEKAIDSALRDMNTERCDPPLNEKRMVELLKGVMRSNMDHPVLPTPITRISSQDGSNPLDWDEVWQREYPPISWVEKMDGIAITGRATNLFGKAGTGKSELVLQRAVEAAKAGVKVLWLDREMTEADVKDRLLSMDYNPGDLYNLRYIMYPELPMLDTEDGGKALLGLSNENSTDVIVVDSLSKFIHGDEQDSGTHTRFYVHSLLPLRIAGRSIVLIDHAGKDISRGARGTSAKKDNVDLFMEIGRKARGAYLETKKQRHTWVAGSYMYRRFTDPIAYAITNDCVFCGAPATMLSGPANKPVCDRHTV